MSHRCPSGRGEGGTVYARTSWNADDGSTQHRSTRITDVAMPMGKWFHTAFILYDLSSVKPAGFIVITGGRFAKRAIIGTGDFQDPPSFSSAPHYGIGNLAVTPTNGSQPNPRYSSSNVDIDEWFVFPRGLTSSQLAAVAGIKPGTEILPLPLSGAGVTADGTCTRCDAGEYTNAAQECVACSVGRWTELDGAAVDVCENTCPVGYGSTAQTGARSQEEACVRCGGDEYQDEAGGGPCKDCVADVGVTSTSNDDNTGCVQRCTPGHYTESATRTCKICREGRISPSGNTADECDVLCPVGWEGRDRDASTTTPSCVRCSDPFEFTSEPGQADCQVCPSGSKSNQASTGCVDVCTPGHFSVGLQCTACPSGRFASTGTEVNECSGTCPPNTYGTGRGKSSEGDACRSCGPSGTSNAGSSSFSSCSCESPYYGDTAMETCRLCPLGGEPNSAGNGCDACPIGSAGGGSGPCVQCDQSLTSYYPAVAGTSCLDCPDGYKGSPDRSRCVPECDPGFIRVEGSTPGTKVCEACPIGRWSAASASAPSSTCEGVCPSGTYGTAGGAYSEATARCLPCGLGYSPPGSDSANDCSCTDPQGNQVCGCDAGSGVQVDCTTGLATGYGNPLVEVTQENVAYADCYQVVDASTQSPKATFGGAENECQARNGHLVSVRSAVQQGHLVSLLEPAQTSWIGLLSNGQWTDNTPVGYTGWASGQPDNQQHFWAVTDANGWNDVDSQEFHNYVCMASNRALGICAVCPPGEVSPGGTSACLGCTGADLFADVRGLSTCKSCSALFDVGYVSNQANTGCEPRCGPGQYTDSSTLQCVDCPSGRFSDSGIEVDQCSGTCPVNTYGTGVGGVDEASACTSCGQGTSPSGAGTEDDCSCEVGTGLEEGVCSTCPAGSSSEGGAGARCDTCDLVSDYQDRVGQAVCKSCYTNTTVGGSVGYIETEDHTGCMPRCHAGEYTNSVTLECESCTRGRFSASGTDVDECVGECAGDAATSVEGASTVQQCECLPGAEEGPEGCSYGCTTGATASECTCAPGQEVVVLCDAFGSEFNLHYFGGEDQSGNLLSSNCYHFRVHDDENGRDDSEAECQTLYSGRSHLASIHNAAEQSFLESVLGLDEARNNPVWIGLNAPNIWRVADSTAALSWTDGSPVTYVNFGTTPQSVTDKCVVMGSLADAEEDGAWDDVSCSQVTSGNDFIGAVCQIRDAGVSCENCGVGRFSPGGFSRCENCDGVDQYQDEEGQSTCKTCPFDHIPLPDHSECRGLCMVGQYWTAQSACQSCSVGRFTAARDNEGECAEACPADYYSNGAVGASTLEGACISCGSGVTPQGATSKEQCVCLPGTGIQGDSCQQCPAGEVSTGGENESCVTCPPRTSNNANHTTCVAIVCPAGQGLNEQEDGCEACQPGTVSQGGIGAACTPCGSTDYQPDVGQATCKSCVADFGAIFIASDDRVSCEAGCPVGNGFDGQSCVVCGPGTIGLGGNTPCQPCDGTHDYQDQSGQSVCKTCNHNYPSTPDNIGCVGTCPHPFGSFQVPARNCWEILNRRPGTPTGNYWLQRNAIGPYLAFCDMSDPANGRTLTLRASTASTSFGYDSAHWTTTSVLGTQAEQTNPTDTTRDMKAQAFNDASGTRIEGCMRHPTTGVFGCRAYDMPISGLSTLEQFQQIVEGVPKNGQSHVFTLNSAEVEQWYFNAGTDFTQTEYFGSQK